MFLVTRGIVWYFAGGPNPKGERQDGKLKPRAYEPAKGEKKRALTAAIIYFCIYYCESEWLK